MTPEQLQACVDDLLPEDARDFEWLQTLASERLSQGWELRKMAWELYQERRLRSESPR
jgi:hypothetical protein